MTLLIASFLFFYIFCFQSNQNANFSANAAKLWTNIHTSGIDCGPLARTDFMVLNRLGSVPIVESTHFKNIKIILIFIGYCSIKLTLIAQRSNSDVYFDTSSSVGFTGILSLIESLQSITHRWSLPWTLSNSDCTYLWNNYLITFNV